MNLILNRQKVAKLGYHRTLSAEAILSLQPDLIVGSDHTGPAPTIRAIKNAHLNFIQLNSPNNITDLTNNIRLLADELNSETIGSQLIQDIQKLEHAIAHRVGQTLTNPHEIANKNN